MSEEFWLGGERRHCAYSAKCQVLRKELEQSLKEGKVLDVEQIAKRGEEKQSYQIQI